MKSTVKIDGYSVYNLGKTPKEKPSCHCSSRFRGKWHALYSDFNDS